MTMKLYLNGAEITFTQRQSGGNVMVTGDGLHEVSLTVEEANHLWNGKRSLGWTSEKPTLAPSKPKVSREEALTAKYGDKEHRRQYVEAKKYFRRYWLNKGLKYGEMFDYTVKLSLNHWEAEGRPTLA